MKKLFVKETKMITGTLFMNAKDTEKFVNDLIFIATVIGIDADEWAASFEMNEFYDKAYRIHMVVPERTWKLLKTAGHLNKINIVGIQEKKMTTSKEMEVAIV